MRLLMCMFLVAACGKSDIPLKEVSDDAFGYAIKVPEGAKQTEKESGRHVWSWSPDENVNSYHCILQVEHVDPFTPETVRKNVAMIRAPGDIKSVEANGSDGIIVEMAEDQAVHYRETWAYRRGKTKTMAAICAGPAKGNTVTQMATSLRATN